ncbi:hypothetical protein SteCoe_7055 [Stentor coeruleus]|uniref:Uncharacterized protein n=1 Tax=Stentor coeruleus TaxID=5963 RepID=A0A1R2CNG3_9CILI|nr:hypothetical protein SteCoe_7055 [Stentor coeruleus]
MEDQKDFLERTRHLREALKKRAMDVESGIVGDSKDDLLEESIKKNIQSSMQFCKLHPDETQNSSIALKFLIKSHREESKKVRNVKSTNPLVLPEIKKAYMPYLKKPSEFPLPKFKKIKGYRVDFTGIEPKIKKLNKAYSTITLRKLNSS